MKKRILVVGDKSVASTGFSTYKKELLRILHEDSRFHMGEYAFCGMDHEAGKVPWDYIPCVPKADAPDKESFDRDSNNRNGRWRWEATILHWKPDIVLSMQDPWQNDYIAYSPLKDFYSLVMAAPVDSHPQQSKFIQIYNEADVVIPYTNYAHKVLSQSGLKNLVDPIPMGVDTSIFHPIDTEKARKEIFMPIPEGAKVIGMVARNQPRKRIPELMQAFKDFLRATDDTETYLYLHTTHLDQMSWDLVRNMIDNSILDRVFFSYVCMKTHKIFAATFRDQFSWSPHTKEMTGIFLNTNNAPSFAELNKVYNVMDLYVQMANAEGFCVPIIEAAATNTPIVGVNYSAYGEVIQEVGGSVLKPLSLEEDHVVAAKRAVMPVKDFAEFFSKQELWGDGLSGRDHVLEKFSWKKSVDQWVEIIKKLDGGLNIKSHPSRTCELPKLPEQMQPADFVNIFAEKLPNAWGPLHLNMLMSMMRGQIQPKSVVQNYTNQINNFNQLEQIRLGDYPKPYWVP